MFYLTFFEKRQVFYTLAFYFMLKFLTIVAVRELTAEMRDYSKSIAEIPAELRPYEKCEAMGAEYLSDPELLAVIIRSGTDNKSALGLAEELLYPNGERISLNKLMQSSQDELRCVKGIGRVRSIQLQCIAELCRRMSREKLAGRERFDNPGCVASYYMQSMRVLSEEEVHIMLLDTRKCFIRSLMISRGTVNCSAISPREIFIKALRYNAASFVMVHNHPSGDPTPSDADIAFSNMVRKLGDLMNIHLNDSVVIGDNSYISMYEKGLIN